MSKSELAAQYLRKRRESYHRTQKEIAKIAGIERTGYNRKENGKTTMSADEFLKALLALEKLGPKQKQPSLSLDLILKDFTL